MMIPRPYRYGIRFVRIPAEFSQAFARVEIKSDSPDVAYFVYLDDAIDTLLLLQTDKDVRILVQNVDRRFPQFFGSISKG